MAELAPSIEVGLVTPAFVIDKPTCDRDEIIELCLSKLVGCVFLGTLFLRRA